VAVALSADLRTAQLEAIADPTGVADAVDAGLLVLEADRARAAHPLLAAAARKHSRPDERRELHRELARVVSDEGLRARHLALAADAPDEELAATVVAAATAASTRGAREEAVELAEHALRLTPPGSRARGDRVLALAWHLETAGELQRVTDLLTPELQRLSPGSDRARAWLLLAEGGHIETFADYRWHLERALEEAHDDPALRARVVANMSSAVSGVERIHEAEAEALAVLPAAHAEPDAEQLVLFALAWARCLRGRPVDEVCKRSAEVSGGAVYLATSPERVAGQRLVWRGEVEQARALFDRLLGLADERGELASYAWARLHLCELELRIGAWPAAARLLDEWAESSEGELLVQPMYERCRALLAAGRGVPDEARRWARDAIARAEAMGSQWEWLEALRAEGAAALLAHDFDRSVESLSTVWNHMSREGVDEPGVFPVAPDLVEALVELGELEEAQRVTTRLRRLADEQAHPWGLATAKRCEALVELAAGYDDIAAEALEQAAADYEALGLRFDAARSLLLLGRSLRRHRKWGAARGALKGAGAAFDELGSAGWAEEARSELARVGARRPAGVGALTPAERRVAELASEGLANKQIAQALFVSVKTVEGHLSHAYAKLGVHSRAQLARRLAEAVDAGGTAEPPG
jgi:DNA-binding CsgD family transcriptional regulator/tetratricopeptide (TPR) repeat protein